MSSTSQWESLDTPSLCDRIHHPSEHHPAALLLAGHEATEVERKHQRGSGSNSFPVEILLTHRPHVPYTDFMLLS